MEMNFPDFPDHEFLRDEANHICMGIQCPICSPSNIPIIHPPVPNKEERFKEGAD